MSGLKMYENKHFQNIFFFKNMTLEIFLNSKNPLVTSSSSCTTSTLEVKTWKLSACRQNIKQGNSGDWNTCKYYFQLRYDSELTLHKARFQMIILFLVDTYPKKVCLIMVFKSITQNKHAINNCWHDKSGPVNFYTY